MIPPAIKKIATESGLKFRVLHMGFNIEVWFRIGGVKYILSLLSVKFMTWLGHLRSVLAIRSRKKEVPYATESPTEPVMWLKAAR